MFPLVPLAQLDSSEHSPQAVAHSEQERIGHPVVQHATRAGGWGRPSHSLDVDRERDHEAEQDDGEISSCLPQQALHVSLLEPRSARLVAHVFVRFALGSRARSLLRARQHGIGPHDRRLDQVVGRWRLVPR